MEIIRFVMLNDTAITTNITVISSKLVIAIIMAFYLQIRLFWILPELEQQNCTNAVESWYNSQIEEVISLPLSEESTMAGVESYRLEANKRLKRLCK